MEFLEGMISLLIILMALKIVETILSIASFWSEPEEERIITYHKFEGDDEDDR